VRRLASVCVFAAVLGVLAGAGCKRRDPVRLQETDENTPALASSIQVADPKAAIQLLKGFHSIEQNAWRWTAGKFAVTLKAPDGAAQKGATLIAKFSLPDPVIAKVKSTTLTASIGGTQVGSATYNAAGEYTFTADVPASAFRAEAVTVDFALSQFLPGSPDDNRELGLVISTIGLEPR